MIKYLATLVKDPLPIFSILITLTILLWFNSYTRYGFDFTDESFYLIWITDPFQYEASMSSFGFFYYPIFKLLGGDIGLFRSTALFFSFVLVVVLSINCLRFDRSDSPLKLRYLFMLSFAVGTTEQPHLTGPSL